MNFRKKASALALCAVLLGTTVAPVSAATHEKLVGKDRYETAAMIADKMGDYETAILVNSDKSLADGLSASSLAGKENAPILLAKQNKLPDATAKRLEDVKKVYIIGGEKAIGKEVESKLAGKEVVRIEGKDRIDTSKRVAELLGDYKKAFVVNGIKGEADAMSVAAVSAREKAPIILTNGKTISDVKKDAYHYVIGGPEIISYEIDIYLDEHLDKVNGEAIFDTIGAENRYGTNDMILRKFYPRTSKLYFTEGTKLVDALTVAPLAKNDGVAFVSEKSDKEFLKDKTTLVQVGGVKDSIIKEILDALTVAPLAKNDGVAFVSEKSDKEFLKDKTTLVQVGGVKDSIIKEILNGIKEDKSSLDMEYNDVVVIKGEPMDYTYFNATAKDIDGTDITDKIQLVGVNTNVIGNYEGKLVVELSNGKKIEREVFVEIIEDYE